MASWMEEAIEQAIHWCASFLGYAELHPMQSLVVKEYVRGRDVLFAFLLEMAHHFVTQFCPRSMMNFNIDNLSR